MRAHIPFWDGKRFKHSKEIDVNDKNRVCPVELSGGLDNGIRRWLQNPKNILRPYCKPGMTALDLGCGPGFFSVEMARLVGTTGRVIACDLQDGMLQKLGAKIKGSDLEKIISLHKCPEGRIGVSEPVDFVLAFYMLHEVPDQEKYFKELFSLFKSTGRFLAVEPPFHVSKSSFSETIKKANAAGFVTAESPRVFLGRTMVFKKA
jgi:ubiquinone/menaquinone biosynthesis C-methylase UbiE